MSVYIIGGIVAILVIGMIASAVIQRQQNDWLTVNSQRVEAAITYIQRGREPAAEPLLVASPASGTTPALVTPWQDYYYVTAEWTDPETHRNYTFKSERLRQLPSEYQEGHKISILIDPRNPLRYKF